MARKKAASRRSGSGTISVGIGSWADPEYTGILFPKGVQSDDRLWPYAEHFGHVEVNSTYYMIPPRPKFAGWVKRTPPDFRFDVKLHRAFSQSPDKTARAGTLVKRLLENARPLLDAGKLGAFFLVLPPSFGPERHSLAELDALTEKLSPHLLAVELRHSGWVDSGRRDETLDYFRRRGLVWIAVDMPRVKQSTIMPVVDAVTNPRLAYLRLHGRRKDWLKLKTAEERHHYLYSAAELKELVKRVRGLAKTAECVHVVANNHAEDFAPKTALGLQRALSRNDSVAR
jgi:uncharacterized protein YecE (DUF72 family)